MASPHPRSWADAPPFYYHGTAPQPAPDSSASADGAGAGAGAGVRSLWIGGLLHWMDEDYLYACFTTSPELLSIVLGRSKQTGQSEGFGFLNFADHTAAAQILKSYNGQKMPNTVREFRLNWVTQQPSAEKIPDPDFKLDPAMQQDAPQKVDLAMEQDVPQRHAEDDSSSEHSLFVGDLSYDVTEYMLHHLFKTRYPSVKSAKIIFDKFTGRSKCFGFVQFGDVNEQTQALTEMNGAYCSTRPMRIGPVPNKKNFFHNKQGTESYDDNNSRLFVGHLDQSVTYEHMIQAFRPYGELTDVKILAGKGCGFVTYSKRASAEEAIRMLNGSQLGGKAIKISWGQRPPDKQQAQRNSGGFGWSPKAYAQTGHPGYGYYQQQLPTVQ